MDSYNLSYTPRFEQQKRLSDLALTKGTPLADLDYQDMFQCLPAKKQQEFMDKRNYFLERSRISLCGRLMNKTERIKQGGSPIIGYNIRRLRNMAMVAKLQLEGIPISTSTLSKIEQGACTPTTEQLIALRKILGCDYSDFFQSC